MHLYMFIKKLLVGATAETAKGSVPGTIARH